MDSNRVKGAWLDWLVSREHAHAVTLKPNPHVGGVPLQSLERLFCKTHMLVDRALLGSRFNLPNRAHKRTEAIGVVEGLPDCGHIHCAFKIPDVHWTKFELLFADGGGRADRAGVWRKLVPHGSSVVVRIGNPRGWYSYVLKDVWLTTDTDMLIFPPMIAAPSRA